MYKNVYYYVDVFSVKVPCYFAIPSDINKERMVQFGLSDKKEIQITFPIEVQASYPIFKTDTELFAGDRMENILNNIYIVSDKKDNEVEKDIWPTGNNNSPNIP